MKRAIRERKATMKTMPWLKHYDEGVPHTLKPYPKLTLMDVVAEAAAQRPDHPALLFKGRTISYAELEQLSNAFGSALVKLGVKKGDRVALLLPNTPQLVLALLGTWKAGAIACPLNPLYTEDELEFSLREIGAETALVMTRFYAKVKAIQRRIKVRTVIATNIKEYLPPALRFLFTLLKEKKEGDRITLQRGDLWLADLLKKHAGAPRPEDQSEAGRLGSHALHRRHDRHTQSSRRHASRPADLRHAAARLVQKHRSGMDGHPHAQHAPVSCLWPGREYSLPAWSAIIPWQSYPTRGT